MAPILSRLSSGGGGGIGGFTFGKRKVAAAASGPISATGGTKIVAASTGNGYTYHVFTSPGSFQVQSAPSSFYISFLVVGGGAGGGWDVGGGGGSGGIAYSSSYPLPPASATYPVQIGSEGIGAQSPGGGSTPNGGDSILTLGANAITGKGGGGAGRYPSGSGATGGSGGGASGYSSPGNPGPANQPSQPTFSNTVINYGYAGGPAGGSSGPAQTGGGGGGAGGVGSTGISNIYGTVPGGPGQPFPQYAAPIISPAIPGPSVPIIGPTGLYAAGGSGAGDNAPHSVSALPSNTGNGGGGAGITPEAGQPGSSGIVIIRYNDVPISQVSGYRYWRLYKTNGAGGGPWTTEVQWTESGSASYYQGTNYQNWTGSGLNSFTAAYVTNGNTSQTTFHTDTAGIGATATLDLGAGNEKYFNKIEIWLEGTGVIAIWDIQASNDGSNWDTLYTGLNVNGYTNISATW